MASLLDYRHIISREDFNYISDAGHFKEILDIFPFIQVHTGNEEARQETILDFLKQLKSFYEWLPGSSLSKVKSGYEMCSASLTQVHGSLGQPAASRSKISKGYVRKFRNSFEKGLGVMASGLQSAFEEHAMATALSAGQLRLYLLDNKVGLGRKFTFSDKGGDSPVAKSGKMNKRELVSAIITLLNPGREAEEKNGWLGLGKGQNLVRFLMLRRRLRSPVVVFLFRLSEHDRYVKFLNENPAKGWQV